MHALEMLELIRKYGKKPYNLQFQFPKELQSSQPAKINYAPKLEYDSNGKLIYQKLSVSEFEKIVTENQGGVPYKYYEGLSLFGHEKLPKKIPLLKKFTTSNSNNRKLIDINDKVAVVWLGEKAGHGIVALQDIPEGTCFLYGSSTITENYPHQLFSDYYKLQGKPGSGQYYTSSYCGNIGRFVNGTVSNLNDIRLFPETPKENFTFLAKFNVTLYKDAEDASVSYYRVSSLIKAGEPLLSEWGKEYFLGAWYDTRMQPVLFDNKSQIINPDGYRIQYIALQIPGTKEITYISLADLIERYQAENPGLTLLSEDKQTTVFLDKNALLLILKEITNEKGNELFQLKGLPQLQHWNLLKDGEILKRTSPYYYSNFLPQAKKTVVQDAAINAYQQQDYQASINLLFWLILQEYSCNQPNLKQIANYYWIIGNAYLHCTSETENYSAEANYCLGKSKQLDLAVFKNLLGNPNELVTADSILQLHDLERLDKIKSNTIPSDTDFLNSEQKKAIHTYTLTAYSDKTKDGKSKEPDYPLAIKLWSWLIHQEISCKTKVNNQELGTWYWCLANAYFKLMQQENKPIYVEEINHCLNKAIVCDTTKAAQVNDRLELVEKTVKNMQLASAENSEKEKSSNDNAQREPNNNVGTDSTNKKKKKKNKKNDNGTDRVQKGKIPSQVEPPSNKESLPVPTPETPKLDPQQISAVNRTLDKQQADLTQFWQKATHAEYTPVKANDRRSKEERYKQLMSNSNDNAQEEPRGRKNEKTLPKPRSLSK